MEKFVRMHNNLEIIKQTKGYMLGPVTDENILVEIQNGYGGERIPEPYIIWNTVGGNTLCNFEGLK